VNDRGHGSGRRRQIAAWSMAPQPAGRRSGGKRPAGVPADGWNKSLDNGFISCRLRSAIATIGEPPWDR
jgi:hypothetical protein